MKDLFEAALNVMLSFVVLFLVTIAGALIMAALLYHAEKNYRMPERIYETYWGIDIPSDFRELYHTSTPQSFHGDGRRYTVIEAEKMNSPLMVNAANGAKETEVYTGTSQDERNKDIEQYMKAISASLEVPEENKPPFDEFYVWKELKKYGNNTLAVLYFPELCRVYFAEELR